MGVEELVRYSIWVNEWSAWELGRKCCACGKTPLAEKRSESSSACQCKRRELPSAT